MNKATGDGERPDARLLVVEDEPSICELLAASLRYAGFQVVTAAAGNEAVEQAGRHRPDLILLDIMLPDMDGFDVVRRLRRGGTHTPLVFLTARDPTEDKNRGLALGGDAHRTQPRAPPRPPRPAPGASSRDTLVAGPQAVLRQDTAADQAHHRGAGPRRDRDRRDQRGQHRRLPRLPAAPGGPETQGRERGEGAQNVRPPRRLRRSAPRPHRDPAAFHPY